MSFGGILRQSTAVDVLVGPFVDSTDGDTEMTALTISQGDVLLSKNGQTSAQKNDATACAHDADGFYNCELDATDTNTVGQLVLYVHEAGALAVRHDFQVIEEAVYDILYAASATGAVPVASIAANAITATAINADAFTAAKFAADVTTELQSGLATAAELAKVPKSDGTATWNATALASINAEADTALADYDPPTKAELDAAVANVSVDEIQATALADLFNTDSGTTYASAVAGSVVAEIADNAGGSALTNESIADEVETRTIAAVTLVNGLAANVITAAATAADFGTEIGTAVWATASRELTALDEDNTTIDLNGTTIGTVTNLTNAPGAGDFTATMKTSIGTAVAASAVASVTGNVGGNVAGSVGSVTGAVGSVTGAVGSVTGNVGGNVTGSVGSLAAQAKADVNAEVLDVLNTDTFAEPGQGAPASTTTLAAKIGYLFKAWRNRSTQTASEYALYADDATTKDQEAAVSDDGTTLDRGEVGTGA